MNHLSDNEHHHDPFHPLATATLETTVFDVVHMFSERGISAVPIVDADGSVIDMYEAVDIVVRLGSPSLCPNILAPVLCRDIRTTN
jgi:CBS domain-containing protein